LSSDVKIKLQGMSSSMLCTSCLMLRLHPCSATSSPVFCYVLSHTTSSPVLC